MLARSSVTERSRFRRSSGTRRSSPEPAAGVRSTTHLQNEGLHALSVSLRNGLLFQALRADRENVWRIRLDSEVRQLSWCEEIPLHQRRDMFVRRRRRP